MKKRLITPLFIILTSIIFCSNIYGDEEGENVPVEPLVVSAISAHEFIGKVGTGYANRPEKFGLDISLNYLYEIDEYFAFGAGIGFF